MWQLYNHPELNDAERADSQLTRGSSLAGWRVEEWSVLKNVSDRKVLDYFKDRRAAGIGCEALRDDCFIESVTVLTNGRIGYPLDHLRVVSIDHLDIPAEVARSAHEAALFKLSQRDRVLVGV